MKIYSLLQFVFSYSVLALPQTPNLPPNGAGISTIPTTGITGFPIWLGSDNTVNDLLQGPCKDIFFIMARASVEWGNMGLTMGPAVCKLLHNIYADRVGCQGIGGPYTASISDNMLPKGTSDAAINEAIKMFTTAKEKCPNAILTFGGFSQGAAVTHNAVSTLPKEVQDKVVAGVLFGDTKNKQDGGQIKNYPKDQLVVFCTPEDGVCGGQLMVTTGHMAYLTNGDGVKAAEFLKAKIDAALKANGRKIKMIRGKE